MSETISPKRRLPQDQRRAQILAAARVVMQRDGLDGFSIESVAREAGVAAALPRHYFDSRDGLMVATSKVVIEELVEPLLARDPSLGLRQRLANHIAVVAKEQWAYAVWMRWPTGHQEVDDVLRGLRRQLAETTFRRPWTGMSPAEQLTALGGIGFCSTTIAEWIDGGLDDRELLLDVLTDGVRRLSARRRVR